MFAKAAAFVVAGLTLTACAITPEDYETDPVLLQTAAGPVTCQLYTARQVTWDRSINRPASMSVETADALCRQEGYAEMRGEGTGTRIRAAQ